jgi:hypothetical protein
MEQNEQIRVCNNDECNWVGWLSDCVHPKHVDSLCLCPECKETTEYLSPEWFKEIRDQLESQKKPSNRP